MIICHIAVDSFPNELRAFLAKFLAPFGIELFLGFEELGLLQSVLLQLYQLRGELT